MDKRVGLVTDQRAGSQKPVEEIEVLTRASGGTYADSFVIPADLGCEISSHSQIRARADEPGGMAARVVHAIQAGAR